MGPVLVVPADHAVDGVRRQKALSNATQRATRETT
jgi:hypothetical protein